MILVDTSIWIDHFRTTDPRLVDLLHDGSVVSHSFVIGELALGSLRRREDVLRLLGALPRLGPSTDQVVLEFVERNRLSGTGIGWVDAHLLSAVETQGAKLLTKDKALRVVGTRLGLSADFGS